MPSWCATPTITSCRDQNQVCCLISVSMVQCQLCYGRSCWFLSLCDPSPCATLAKGGQHMGHFCCPLCFIAEELVFRDGHEVLNFILLNFRTESTAALQVPHLTSPCPSSPLAFGDVPPGSSLAGGMPGEEGARPALPASYASQPSEEMAGRESSLSQQLASCLRRWGRPGWNNWLNK